MVHPVRVMVSVSVGIRFSARVRVMVIVRVGFRVGVRVRDAYGTKYMSTKT